MGVMGEVGAKIHRRVSKIAPACFCDPLPIALDAALIAHGFANDGQGTPPS